MSTGSRRSTVDGISKTNEKVNHISNGTNNSNNSNMTNELERSRQSMREKYKDLLIEGVNTHGSPIRVDRSRDINRTPLFDDKNYMNKESSIYKEFKKSLGEKKDESRTSQRSGNSSKYDQLDYLDDSEDENGYDDYDYEQEEEKDEDYNVTAEEEDDEDDEDDELGSLNEGETDFYSKTYQKPSFLSDETDSFDDNEYDLDEHQEDLDEEPLTTYFTWKKLLYFLLGLFVFGYFYRKGDEKLVPYNENTNNHNFGGSFRFSSNAGSFTNIQKQINHLYNELSTRDKRWNTEFDAKLKIVISQFEKNIKSLLPPSLLNVESEIKSINTKIQNLQESTKNIKPQNFEFSLTNVTSLQKQLVSELEKELPTEIPVMVNNSSSMLIIPEMHNYISHLLSNLIKYSNVTLKEPSDSLNKYPLNYDLNNYIKEILTNEFQYINKDFFINELNSRLQANKLEILHDLKDNIQMELTRFNENNAGKHNGFSERYSTVLLKRLINQIYDVNQHQWGNDLDFMTFAQGTRLMKSLTSSTSLQGNGIAPMQMLSDNKLDSSSTYWQCQPNNEGECNLAIRFNKPIHLTKISYLHGRFTNNLHMMNSAPRKISVYVKLTNGQDVTKLQQMAERFNEGQSYSGDKTFIKIQTYEYDIFSKKIKQNFPLPPWFIPLKPLVKSMIFQVDSNYGNKDYTSLKKFIVNGVTETDLAIMKSKSFPMYDYKSNETSSPEYHYDYNSEQQPRFAQPIQQQITSSSRPVASKHIPNKKNVPSFGDDQKVV